MLYASSRYSVPPWPLGATIPPASPVPYISTLAREAKHSVEARRASRSAAERIIRQTLSGVVVMERDERAANQAGPVVQGGQGELGEKIHSYSSSRKQMFEVPAS